MSGLFGSNNSTVTNRTDLPDWIEDFAKSGLEQADSVAANLAAPYQGPMVAGMNDQQRAALDATAGVMGSTNAAYNAAQGGAQGVMNFAPQQVQGQSFLGGNINAYMSPYTANVEQAAIQQLDDQRLRALNQTADQAIAAGGFGGSRQGVMEGVLNAEAAKSAGQLSAGLRDQAFRQGAAMMDTDLARAQQAAMANQQAGLQGAGLNLQGAATMGDLATQGQQTYLQGLQAALGAGNQYQMQDQAALDADRLRYEELKNYPLQQLDIRMAALGMTPYGSTTTQTQPTSTNYGMLGIGGALAGAQLAGTLGYSSGIGAGLGGLVGLLGASDESLKKDVQRIGLDKNTGLGVYAFRYKGDDPSYPKVVGPMASSTKHKDGMADVYPERVVTVGGKKAIKNMGFGGAG